jgi:hypothetical protein
VVEPPASCDRCQRIPDTKNRYRRVCRFQLHGLFELGYEVCFNFSSRQAGMLSHSPSLPISDSPKSSKTSLLNRHHLNHAHLIKAKKRFTSLLKLILILNQKLTLNHGFDISFSQCLLTSAHSTSLISAFSTALSKARVSSSSNVKSSLPPTRFSLNLPAFWCRCWYWCWFLCWIQVGNGWCLVYPEV